jgi:anti-anti-sigma factor
MAKALNVPQSLFVDLVFSDEVDIVVARGEIDVSNAAQLGRALREVLNDRDGDVLIDLREIDFIDSNGAHHLLNAHRRLTRQGRHFGVLCSPGQVQRMLKALRLVHTLSVDVDA